PGTAPGVVPRLPGAAGPVADRPALAGQGRCRRPGPGHVPGSPPPLCPVPRDHGGRVGRMAAANPGRVARQPRAALLRHTAPRRAAGGGAGGSEGRVLAGPRPEPGGRVQHAEPAGRPPRTGGAAGRCTRPVVPGLSGGYHPASSRRADVPRGGAAHGPECGQRQEPLGPRPGPVATFTGSFRMSTTIDVPGGAGALPVTVPKVAVPAADDPRVVRALEAYSAAVSA